MGEHATKNPGQPEANSFAVKLNDSYRILCAGKRICAAEPLRVVSFYLGLPQIHTDTRTRTTETPDIFFSKQNESVSNTRAVRL